MRRLWVVLALLACMACAAPHAASPPASTVAPSPKPKATVAKPTPTLPPVPAGGIVAMGRTVITRTQSRVTVTGWHRYANRSIPNGPGQVYETVGVSFCAGPQVQETADDL